LFAAGRGGPLIGGLILAAGDGTRFAGDTPKLLATLDGRPLLEHAVRAQTDVPEIERIVVVLGARADDVRAAVDFGRAEAVICADWPEGQSASLRCGAAVLADAGADRVIVTLGDAPLLTPAVVRRFLEAPPGARAVYDGRPGHPVVLGRAQLDRLGEVTGDAGARSLLSGGPRIECSDLGSGRDVDTHEDLEAIRDAARAVV
jgi:CTP:molybdopterin cytidylyltransferase MocA